MDTKITTTTPVPLNPARHAMKAVSQHPLFLHIIGWHRKSFPLALKVPPAFSCHPQIVQTVFPLRKFVVNHRAQSSLLPRLFSLISCFGAGVFLATCLLDLLPDTIESVAKAEAYIGRPIEFPLPAFSIAIGFLLNQPPITFWMVLHAQESNWIGGADILSHHHSTPQQPASQDHCDDIGRQQHSTMRVLMLVFALTVHAVFEGLSVGMISEVSVLLQVFAALLIHKSIVGFSLAVRLVQSPLRPFTIVLCCTVFAAQVLVGGFVGLAIVDVLSGQASMLLITGILQAIACGTFLYITTFEVLPHELAHGHNSRPLKMVALVAGFALITGFVALFPDADDG